MFVQNSFKGEPLQLPEEHSRRWSLPCKNVSVAETRIQSARFQPHSQHYRLGTAVLLLSTCPSLWGSREPCPQGVSPRHPSIAAGSACMLVGHVAPGEPPPPTKPGGMPYSGCSETPPAQPGSVWVLPVRPNTLGMPPFRRQNTTPLCNKHNAHQRGIFLQERYFVPFFLPTSRLSTLFIPHCLIIYNF